MDTSTIIIIVILILVAAYLFHQRTIIIEKDVTPWYSNWLGWWPSRWYDRWPEWWSSRGGNYYRPPHKYRKPHHNVPNHRTGGSGSHLRSNHH